MALAGRTDPREINVICGEEFCFDLIIHSDENKEVDICYKLEYKQCRFIERIVLFWKRSLDEIWDRNVKVKPNFENRINKCFKIGCEPGEHFTSIDIKVIEDGRELLDTSINLRINCQGQT